MKVLLLLNSYEETEPSIQLLRLCERWASMRELSIETIAFGPDGPVSEQLRELGIGSKTHPARGVRDWRDLRDFGRAMLHRGDRPDAIHSHCVWPDLEARFFHHGHPNVPLVSTVYGLHAWSSAPPLQRFLGKEIEKRTRGWCSKIVVSSKFLADELYAYGMEVSRIARIPMGIDAVQCFPLSGSTRGRFRMLMGVPAGVPILVSAGRFVETKGHLDLIDAMPAVLKRHPHTRLFLVGDGPLRPAIEERIAALRLADSVRIIGPLAETLRKVLGTADIVVHPSRREALSLVVAEAQACGAPIVATRDGAIPEVVRDGVTGLLVSPGNVAALADAIVRLLDDPGMRERMGEAGRTLMRESFEISETAERTIALWRELSPAADWKGTDSIPVEELEDFKRESKENLMLP